MIRIASLSLTALIASVALALTGWGSRLAVVHLAVAAGILPLILGAMIHFVPVLTRTGDPRRSIALLPWLAQGFGLMVAGAMQGWLPYGLVALGAAGDLVVAVMLIHWIARRARLTVGSPHPGWRWYAVSLSCLVLALLGILALFAWPAYWHPLRLFHLHLNTLGFVGMAAFGTLPVLMPTALGKPDPEAPSWLRRRLWLVASGALIVATGSAIDWAFSAPGAALLLVAALGLGGQWVRRFHLHFILADGVALSLLVALIGFLLAMSTGILHGAGLLPAPPALVGWGAAFLLPLVTGALSQLLPVWRWPGPNTVARQAMRQKLAATGLWRGMAFIAGGMAGSLGHAVLAGVLVGTGMLLFIIAVLQAVGVERSTR